MAKNKVVKERADYLAETLLQNEALLDNLDDDTAKVAFNWVADQATKVAEATAGEDDDAAAEKLELGEAAIKSASKRINKWIPKYAGNSRDANLKELKKFLDATGELLAQQGITVSQTSIDDFLDNSPADKPALTLKELLKIVK